MKNELPRIYCDMDGVLADFAKGVEKIIGKSIDQWSYGSKSEKWDTIKSTPKFWHTLPWMNGGKELWNFISKHDTHILSAYVEESFDPNCIPGKSHWARTNLRLSPGNINLVKRVEKHVSQHVSLGLYYLVIVLNLFLPNVIYLVYSSDQNFLLHKQIEYVYRV